MSETCWYSKRFAPISFSGEILRLRALLLSATLLLTGCSFSPSPTEQIQSGSDFTEQQITWQACESGFECSSVAVPLDHLNLDDQIFEIALIRKAGTANLRPLLVNPGGPGASGVDYVRDNYDTLGTTQLRDNFQIIGFDPRGVGLSAPVTCSDQNLKDQVYYEESGFPLGSPADFEFTKDVLERFAASCQETGFSIAYFNTQQAARDMDLIRSALGVKKLDYLGFSYGTELGATYVALFPDRVGRFVLDGAVDPTLSSAQSTVNQVAGFDKAFRSYLKDCLAQLECPFQGNVDAALKDVAELLTMLETKKLPTQYERESGLTVALYGIIAALTQAFQEAFNGDGSTLLLLADFYHDKDPEGGYLSNISEANTAINCADERAEPEDFDQMRKDVLAASAVFGKYFGYPELSCLGWPRGESMIALDYAVPLEIGPLVVGTTGDPATPYEQAVSLANLLSGAKLLTYVGEGHTAYGSSDCVNQYVEDYLLGANLTSSELRCE
jgi:pimeloyl-ACP methyl ester carboxylesterase